MPKIFHRYSKTAKKLPLAARKSAPVEMEFAASVVAIVEVSVNITVWCVQYAKDARHADEEIANLCREIGGLQAVLVRLQTSSTPSELLLY